MPFLFLVTPIREVLEWRGYYSLRYNRLMKMEKVIGLAIFVVDGAVSLLLAFALAVGLALFSAWMGWPDAVGLSLMGVVIVGGLAVFWDRLRKAVDESY
jgi:uncharacterized membrane protein